MTEEEIINKFELENITLASNQKRFFAFLVDELIVSVLFSFVFLQSTDTSGDDIESLLYTLNSLVMYVIILKVLYQAFFTHMYGATLGKILFKIRVVSLEDIENPAIIWALNRAIVRIFSESLFYIGFIWALFNPKKQAWHDMTSKTLVVNVF